MRAYERLLNYVKVYTTSDPVSDTHPTTARQFDLARMLVKELQDLGLADAHVDEHCYVYATLPATPGHEAAKGLGFIAHMDTSPDASGHDIHPRIIRSYPGGRIILNEEKNHSAAALPGDGVQPDPHHRLGGKQQYRCAASVRRQYRDGRQGQGRR